MKLGIMRMTIFFTMLLCQFSICLASERLEPNDPNRYLNAVCEFADNVLKYGRDTYGPKHTPLFVDGLMVRDPNNPNYGKDGGFKPVEWIAPNGDRWILSNLASQQTLFRTLDGLTRITGDPKYKQAAMDAIRYAFDNLRTPNGLLYWGGQEAYDLGADRPCGRMIHELKSYCPYYELMWEVDPQATKQFIEAFWSGHILNWSNLEMDRHFYNMNTNKPLSKPWDYQYRGGPIFFEGKTSTSFLSTGDELFFAASVLSKLSGKGEPLVWAKRLAHRYIETRDPITGISAYVYSGKRTKLPTLQELQAQGYLHGIDSFFPFCPTRGDSDVIRCTYGYCNVSPGIPFNPATRPWICALLVGEMMSSDGKEFIQWALEEIRAQAKAAYRRSDNSWIPMTRDGHSIEGLITKKTGFGPEGTVLRPMPATPFDFWAYTLAYRLTGNDFMWEMVRNIALGNGFGDIDISRHSVLEQKYNIGCSDPYAIMGFLELYKKTHSKEFLDFAKQIGDNILNNRFHKGFFLPSGNHIYTRLNNPESLSLIHLYVVTKSCQAEVPTMWPAAPFFEHAYRYRDEVDDTSLIYTLIESPEPPISLQEAAHNGDIKLVSLLLEKGTRVDGREDSFYKTALHRAVLSGHKEVAELLLANRANIEAQDSYGDTALHYAAGKGYKEIVEMLIEKGGYVNAKNNRNVTPLHIAAQNGHKQIVELLIINSADINAETTYGDTPLQYAAFEDNKEIIELLLQKGATITNLHIASYMGDLEKAETFINEGAGINAIDVHVYAPLHYAVQNNQKQAVELLVNSGADVNATTWLGQTPLHIAVNRGYRDIADLLINKGANINIKNNEGQTPLDIAVMEGRMPIVKTLIANGAEISSIFVAAFIGDFSKVKGFLEKGIDVNAKDTRKRTALQYAAEEGHNQIVELLLEHDAEINAGNRTAAELAMNNGHIEIVELLMSKGADISPLHLALRMKDEVKARSLIEAGADINKRTKYGTTPLHMAVGANLKSIANLLIENGADVNAQNNWGWTPLFNAVYRDKEMVELLLTKGANVNVKDGNGRTPLWYAVKNNRTEIAELLRKHSAKE